MKRCLLILVVLFPYFGYAQVTGEEMRKKLVGIEKLLFTKPDSAQVLIRQITRQKNSYQDTIYAMANIFHGYYHLQKSNLDSSIYYYGKALDFASNSPVYRAKILRFMAVPYRKQGNYEKSLQLLRRSETDFSAIDNTSGLATVYGEMAANYNAMLRPQAAIPYLIKSIDLFKKAKNKKDILPIQQSLANTYMNIGNYDFAVELYEKVLMGFKDMRMFKNYYITLINYGESLVNLGKIEAAKKSLLEAIAGLEQFKDRELIGRTYAALGRIANSERNFDESEDYFEKAFRYVSSENSVLTVSVATAYLGVLTLREKVDKAFEIVSIVDNSTYKIKANLNELALYEKAKTALYRRIEKPDLAIESAKNTIALLDTLSRTEDKKTVLTMQGQIQQEYQTSKSEKLKEANSRLTKATDGTRRTKWISIYLPLIVLAVLIFYYFYSTARHRKKIASSRVDALIMMEEYENKKQVNDALKTERKQQQRELLSGTQTIGTIQYSVDKMIAILSTRTRTSGPADIDIIKEDLKEIITDTDYWALFRENFSHTNSGFGKKLEVLYPDLSKKELFFCSLLRLALPNKDLAIILQVTPEAVKKKKNRLRKKIENISGGTLEDALSNIS